MTIKPIKSEIKTKSNWINRRQQKSEIKKKQLNLIDERRGNKIYLMRTGTTTCKSSITQKYQIQKTAAGRSITLRVPYSLKTFVEL